MDLSSVNHRMLSKNVLNTSWRMWTQFIFSLRFVFDGRCYRGYWHQSLRTTNKNRYSQNHTSTHVLLALWRNFCSRDVHDHSEPNAIRLRTHQVSKNIQINMKFHLLFSRLLQQPWVHSLLIERITNDMVIRSMHPLTTGGLVLTSHLISRRTLLKMSMLATWNGSLNFEPSLPQNTTSSPIQYLIGASKSTFH